MDDRDSASFYEIEIGIVVPALIYAPVCLAEYIDAIFNLALLLQRKGSYAACGAAYRSLSLRSERWRTRRVQLFRPKWFHSFSESLL
jgi:hypothetical protein